VPLREWTYNNPRNTSWHCRNYRFGEWNTCLEGGFPPFPSPHLMTSGYSYHEKWFSNCDGHCHCWFDSHRYDVANIDDGNTCSDDGCSGEGKILYRMNTRRWFHSLCYWDIWVFSVSFWFIFYRMCIDHYFASLAVFFGPFNAYFSLLTMCVHSHVMCASQSNFLAGCYIWLGFFILSTHHN
jgi:hypothetical protein